MAAKYLKPCSEHAPLVIINTAGATEKKILAENQTVLVDTHTHSLEIIKHLNLIEFWTSKADEVLLDVDFVQVKVKVIS